MQPIVPIVQVFLNVPVPAADAHNLDTVMTSVDYDAQTRALINSRLAVNDTPLLRNGDEVGMIIKVTPTDGTATGAGGYVDFYVPNQAQVVDAGYMQPDANGNLNFAPMKGPALDPLGYGPISPASTAALIGLHLGPNIAGVQSDAVSATGVHLGTLAGIYADTGIFYSTDPTTAWQTWVNSNPPLGTNITNNRGEVVVPYNKWDAMQLYAFGIKSPVAPIVDPNGRGNAPWGMAGGVAGPQSGYAWSFDKDYWDTHPSDPNRMKNSIVVGPWKRIQYPGSGVSKDVPGYTNNSLGYWTAPAATLGVALNPSNPLPLTTSQTDTTSPKTVRWSLGETTLNKPEYVWVKVKLYADPQLQAGQCTVNFNADTFGGDAAAYSNGKDHIWRYYEPTTVAQNACIYTDKQASAPVGTGQFNYNLTVINTTSTAIHNVVVTDQMPSGVTYISANPTPNSTNPLTWNIGDLPPGGKWSATVTVKSTSSGVAVNTMCVAGSDYTKQCTFEGTPQGNVPIIQQSKTVTPTTVQPGGTVQYTIQVSNIGSAASNSPIPITDFLPSGFTYQSLDSVTVNGADATSVTTVNASNLQQPIFTVGSPINAGQDLFLKFTAKVSSTLLAGTYCNQFNSNAYSVVTSGQVACVTVAGATIGDTIFRDWDGNGTQTPATEPGIPGVTVNLYSGACPPSGSPLATQTTDASGTYLFNGVPAGTYCVAPPTPGSGGIPAGYTATTTPNPLQVAVASGDQFLTADFGYKPGGAGAIGDTVWNDANNNGVQDGGEAGIPSITVELYADNNNNGLIDAGDPQIGATTTNGSGVYGFSGLATGLSYIVNVNQTQTNLVNYPGFGGNTPVPTTPDPIKVPNLAGSVTNADFGFLGAAPGSIGDQVCVDNNRDGLCNAGDTGINGVVVDLYLDRNGNGQPDASEFVGSQTTGINPNTNGDGYYTFPNLLPGAYIVTIDPNQSSIPFGYTPQVSSISVPLAVGQTVVTADFPFTRFLTKTVDKNQTATPDTLTYTLYPFNPGPQLMTGGFVSDPIPASTTYVAGSANAGGYYDAGTNSVIWPLGDNLPATPGQTASGGAALCPVPFTAPLLADTWIDKDKKNNNNGGNALLFTRPADANHLKYTLLKFDVSGIPAGATINTATLQLTTQTARASNHFDQVHELLTPWTQGTANNQACNAGNGNGATWNAANCTGSWAAGAFSSADYAPGVLGTIIPKANNKPATANIAAAVNDWVNNNVANNGIVLVSTGKDAGDAKYYSGQASNASYRPTLTGTYLVPTPGGCSGTATLTSVADTFVQKNKPTEVQGSATTMQTNPGNNNTTNNTNYSLVQFDLSSIPPGATINSASLTLTVNASRANNHVDEVHRLLTSWTEAAATWNKRDGVVPWAGGAFSSLDYGATVYASITPSPNGAQTLDVTALVKKWVTDGAPNDGLGLISTGSDNGDAKYDTREANSGKPTLTVNWAVSPGPSVSTVTTLRATPYLQTTTSGSPFSQIQVTMTVNATDGTINNVTPPPTLNVLTAADVTASLASGPTPAGPVTVSPGNPATFTYVYNVSQPASSVPRQISFSGTAQPNASFAQATSETLIVTPPLTFQVLTNNPATTSIIFNQGTLADNASFPDTPSNQVQTSLTNGAGGSGSIGDTVWADLNGNGVQDSGEPGIPNVTVTLTGGICNPCTTTTDANGHYLFTLLNAGSYTVSYDQTTVPAGYIPTTPTQISHLLAPAESFLQADFGLEPPGTGSIGDTVWLDSNNSGAQEAGEPGLPNVGVTLYKDTDNSGTLSAGDVLLQQDTTDANGQYLFTGLVPGKYLVVVDQNSSVTTPENLTTTIGAAMNPTTGTVNPRSVTLTTPGQSVLTADFGYNWGGSIGDTVYYDNNFNKQQDNGEPGVPNAVVDLFQDNNGNGVIDPAEPQLAVAITDANGKYLFANLPPGDYVVEVEDQTIPNPSNPNLFNMVATTGETKAITLQPNTADLTADFGFAAAATLGDQVYRDLNANGQLDPGEPGISGVQVQLYDSTGLTLLGSTTSAANGYYEFLVAPGTYVVKVSPSAVAGSYLSAPPGGSYTNTVIPGDAVTTDDFGFAYNGAIGDTVFNDVNGNGVQNVGEAGIPNVTVLLKDGSNNTIRVLATDALGKYLFKGLSDGTYTVVVDTTTLPAGWVQTADPDQPGVTCTTCDSQGTATISGGNQVLTQDFGYRAPSVTTYSVSGTVWNDADKNGAINGGEAGLAGVTVRASVDTNGDNVPDYVFTIPTDNSGNYTIGGIPAGSNVTVTSDAATLPAPISQWTQTAPTPIPPGAYSITGISANQTQKNFGYAQELGSIAGKVCVGDTNGQCNAGEPGLANVPVSLIDTTTNTVVGSTTTDGSGAYSFTNRPPLVYQVTTTPLSGYTSVSDADGGNPNLITVNLAAGQNVTGRDFEVAQLPTATPTPSPTPTAIITVAPGLGAVQGIVFNDANQNGVKDGGEQGVPGVTVTLLGPNNTVVATTTTGPTGAYSFPNLAPGPYTVQVTTPNGYFNTTPVTQPVTAPANGAGSADFGISQTPLPATATPTRTPTPTATPTVSPNSGTVDGTVYNDANLNGTKDPGEGGIPGVTVGLYQAGSDGIFGTGDDVLVATTTTDGLGNYAFYNRPAGTYQVRETVPSGYSSTTPTAVSFSLPAGGTRTVDFGNVQLTPTPTPTTPAQPATISGTVYDDLNGDGGRDTGEPGMGGVTVELINPTTGAVIATTVTSGSGGYTFPNLTPGPYVVKEILPVGFTNTTPNPVTLTAPAGGTAIADFGNQQQGTVNGTVYNDVNGDGVQQAGEPGLSNVTVQLISSTNNTVVGTTTTDASGYYSFGFVNPGPYVVKETTPSGYSATTPTNVPVSVPAGGAASADFGNQQTATIAGRVFNDVNGSGVQEPGEAGIPNVTVQLVNPADGITIIATTTTDASGAYIFTSVTPGIYDVRETDPAGYASTTPNDVLVAVPAGGVGYADFGDRQLAAIVGVVTNDLNGNGAADPGESGLSGVTIQLYGPGTDNTLNTVDDVLLATTQTATDGSYAFTPLVAGTYLVKETDPAGFVSTSPNSVPVVLPAGGVGIANFADQQIGSVSGIVFNDLSGNGMQDAGEPGVGGVTVQLVNAQTNQVVATTTTAGDGYYVFTSVPSGNYKVVETVPAGYGNTTPTTVNVAVPPGGAGYANFGVRQNGTVSGIKFNDLNGNGAQDAGEPPLGGVVIQLATNPGGQVVGTAITAADGTYIFTNVAPGSYTVSETVTPPLVNTSASSVTVTVPSGGSASANFFNWLKGAISGIVVNDLNGNGQLNPGEVGIGGVTIQLVDPVTNQQLRVTTTLPDGTYQFLGVTPGNYKVLETDPVGFQSVTANTVSVTVPSNGSAVANFFDQPRQAPTAVQLMSFTADVENGTVIEWATATESGVTGFRLLRSAFADDGYRQVGEVIQSQGLGGAGSLYQVTDRTARPGTWYYRLEALGDGGQVIGTHGPLKVEIGPQRTSRGPNPPKQ
ncbi:MAG: SdrD B-like domain-containing protein [Anaerolineae bacterium]